MESEIFEKIALYLQGELKGEELAIFEEQLKNDAALREQVSLYKTIDNEMKQKMTGSEEESKLKETLSGFNKKYFNQPGSTTAPVRSINERRKWLFAAAAIVFIVLAAAYWSFFSGSKGNEKLYAQYAVYPSLSVQRGGKDPVKALQDAITAYNNRNFTEALKGLNSYLQTDSSDTELLLAEKICLIETGDYQHAIDGLNNIVLKNEIFASQALWYKALAYLKQNNKTECKKVLSAIPSGADTYTKARKLLEEL
jgi:tetratricopeptide (TPR) repeat protein